MRAGSKRAGSGAGAVLGLMHRYPSLFALAALASLVAGVTITRVRSVP